MISLLCPTRKRPLGMEHTYESAQRLCSDPNNLEIWYYIDNDDIDSIIRFTEIRKLYKNSYAIVGPRIILSNCWNRCYEMCSGNICFICNDDLEFRTPNWDIEVMNAFKQYKDEIVLVYGDDGMWQDRHSAFYFISRTMVKALGYFAPPYFAADYNDTWMFDVACKINRKCYLPQVSIQHTKVNDETDNERKGRVNESLNIYNSLTEKRNQDIQKLLSIINEK